MKSNFLLIYEWIKTRWRGLFSVIIICVIIALTIVIQLNIFKQNINHLESINLNNISDLYAPWYRAINAPYNIFAHYLGNYLDNFIFGARLTSLLFGLAASACFYYVIKLWFNVRIALVGTLLFLTSSWFLSICHEALPTILLVFMPLAILASFNWYLQTTKFTFIAFCLFVASLAIGAYIPYVPWIIMVSLLILIIKGRKQLDQIDKKHFIIACLIYFILILPLFISLVTYPGQIRELLGIPVQLPSIIQYFTHLGYTITMIFIFSPTFPDLFLGRLPMLDIFSTIMLLLGIYYYAKRIKFRRSIILFSCYFVLLIIVPISPIFQLTASILLPLIYILIITGIVEILNQWYAFFPRNPWARNLGVMIVVIAIGLTTFYQLQRYFIAWPSSPSTKNAYSVQYKSDN